MEKDMIKFLKRLALFIPFALVVYCILIIIWGGFIPQILRKNMLAPQGLYFTYERLQEVKTKSNLDILFLGSSRTYRGFDTRIFSEAGYSTFNLGTSSQTPVQTRLLLERYLKDLNPRIVVFEVSPDAFSMDGIESAMEMIANDSNDPLLRQMMLQYNDIRLYNTWLYKYFWDFTRKYHIPWGTDTHQKNLYARIKGKDLYIPGGYVEKEMLHFRHIRYTDKQQWPFRENQFTEFCQCMELLKSNHTQIILIQSPYTCSLYESYTNNVYFDSCMNKYGKYYNFNNIIQLDDSLHFYDATHLNQDGVNIFNKEVVELVNKCLTNTISE